MYMRMHCITDYVSVIHKHHVYKAYFTPLWLLIMLLLSDATLSFPASLLPYL